MIVCILWYERRNDQGFWAGQGLTRKRFASGWSGDPMSVSGVRVEREMDEDAQNKGVSINSEARSYPTEVIDPARFFFRFSHIASLISWISEHLFEWVISPASNTHEPLQPIRLGPAIALPIRLQIHPSPDAAPARKLSPLRPVPHREQTVPVRQPTTTATATKGSLR